MESLNSRLFDQSINKALLAGIRGYQTFLAPLKPFQCAHAAYHGGHSCSGWARAVIESAGWRAFFAGLRRRVQECRHASIALRLNKSADGNFDGSTGTRKSYFCCCIWPF